MGSKTADQTIMEFWDNMAEGFDEAHSNEDKERWRSYFHTLLGFSGDQKVLDIGTGTGFLAIMAAQEGFRTTGIDFSEKMLSIARKKAETAGLKIQFLQANWNKLPFEDQVFDYLVNSRVLWTITDPDIALNEWFRVLKEDGELLSFVRLADDERIRTDLDYYNHEVYGQLRLKFSSGEELMEICKKAGFSQVDLVKLPGINDNRDGYGEWYVLRALKEKYQREKMIEAISDFWDHRSETYESAHELTSKASWKSELEKLLGPRKEIRILDLATGTGMIANMLARIGYTDVTGMDISEGMMQIAKEHAKQEGLHVKYIYGNALELPLQDHSIDVLISCRLLWTLVEPDKALEEWIRVVKNGGRIIALHEMEDIMLEKGTWQQFLYGKNADPYTKLTSATKSDYFNLFRNSGLSDVELIHMENCDTLSSGRFNWYALTGTVKKNE